MALTPGPVTGNPSLLAGIGADAAEAIAGNPNQALAGIEAAPIQSPQVTQAPSQYQTLVAPAPITDKRSFTQKLLGGLLSGLAGGAAAPTNSQQGGVLGLQQQQRQENEAQQQLQVANQNQARQFQQQQQAAENQRQNQQQMNADDLHVAQMHNANLNQLEIAHRLAQLPLDDQVHYAKAQAALFEAKKKTGVTPILVDGSYAGLNNYLKQNPKAQGWETIHLSNPTPGAPDQVAFIPPAQPGQKPLSTDAKIKALKAVNAPFTPEQVANMSDADVFKATNAYGLEDVKQRGQNARSRVVQGPATPSKPRGTTNPNGSVATANPTSLDAKIDALHNGTAVASSFIGGRGSAKEVKALTDAWLSKHPDDAPKVEKFKSQLTQANKAPVISALQTGRTLFAPNGTIDQIEGLVNNLPRAEIPAITKWIQSGSYQGGNTTAAAVLSSLPDISQELATFNSGATGRSSDKRIDLAEQQLRKADTPEQFKASLKTLRDIALARYNGIVGSGEDENKFITSQFRRSDYDRSAPKPPAASGGVVVGGFKFPNQAAADQYAAALAKQGK